jgi:hypothetical protein
MHRSTLKYTLTAVLATGAIATSPALAMPIDAPVNRDASPTSSLAGTTEENLKKQDLRNENSKDAAIQAAKDEKLQPGQPVFPSYVPPLPKPETVNASTSTNDDGDDVGIWLLLLSGLAGAGLAGGGAAGITRRSRLRARRVAA